MSEAPPKDGFVTHEDMNLLRASQQKPEICHTDIAGVTYYYKKNQTLLILNPESPEWIEV